MCTYEQPGYNWHQIMSNQLLFSCLDVSIVRETVLRGCLNIPFHYSRAKGVWCASVISMITKYRSDRRSDRNALEWESKFTLELNTANNTNYIKKCFKQKLFRIKLLKTKKITSPISLSPPEIELRDPKYCHFRNIKMY